VLIVPRSRPARRPEGVVVRHGRRCASRTGAGCDCRPGYQAQVWSARDRKTIRKTFRTLADARAWRAEAHTALRRGTLRAPSRTTLAEAAEAWLTAARSGLVRTRSGDPYKPSALRGYEQSLRTKLLPELGHLRLSAVTRTCVQDLVDGMLACGFGPSTVRNAVLPLRAIYRRALSRSEVLVNPTVGLTLPAYRGRRERVARASEAQALLAVLSEADPVVWATALYAGLRRGELRALRWSDVDLDAGLIRVERGWDDRVGPIAPKSRASRRRVPLAQPLRAQLAAHRLRQRPEGEALVFGRADGSAFSSEALTLRARKAWRRAGLEPIGLHECRHTYAAFMIAAGVNAKARSAYMGHSTITMTLDRYGHLLPGAEDEAAAMLATYLHREMAG
jgi:integrase